MGAYIEKMKTNLRVNEIMTHLKTHKAAYIAGAGGLAIGIVGAMAATRNGGDVTQDTYTTVSGEEHNVQVNVLNEAENVTFVTTYLTPRGDPGNRVLWDQTGEVFASQNRTAEVAGVSPARLSEHLNGKRDQVDGQTFTKLGKAV